MMTAITPETRALVESLQAVCFDFDGVFTDNTVFVDEHGIESVRCWRGDGLGLSRLRQCGIRTVVLSTEVNPVVSARARKLQIECVQGISDKAAALETWSASAGIPFSRMAFVGNDMNDLPALRLVALPIAVADAHESIMPFVGYITRARGGYGAVREICDLIADSRGGGGRV